MMSSSATGLRNRFTVRLKLISPSPVITAPNRGRTGISQASSAAEGIHFKPIELSVGSSAEQGLECGVAHQLAGLGNKAMGPPKHAYCDGNSQLCRTDKLAPIQFLATIEYGDKGH